MTKYLEKHFPEIIILVFGVIISGVSAFLNYAEFAALCFIITLSTDSILFSVQLYLEKSEQNISQDINKQFKLTYLKAEENMSKISERWKDDVYKEINMLLEKIGQMADGFRRISPAESISYQADLLSKSQDEVLAIHIGDSLTALQRWDEKKTTKDFTAVLITANKKCPAKKKKRLFVVEGYQKTDYLKALSTALETQEKLGFEVKVISREVITAQGYDLPKDMLICDQKEVVVVNFNGGQIDAHAYVSESEINDKLSRFYTLWNVAQVEDKAKLKDRIKKATKAENKKTKSNNRST